MVGKSCKPIPVMVLGVLLGGKSYPMIKYLFILTIVLGVGLFMYKDNVASNTDPDASGLGIGEFLLVIHYQFFFIITGLVIYSFSFTRLVALVDYGRSDRCYSGKNEV